MAIQLKLDKTSLQPEEVLAATVAWEFDTIPSSLKLELLWETSGKGTEDSEIVHTENWKPDAKQGERRFSIPLPRGPLSVQGNLIAIRWYVACTSKKPNSEIKVPFVLSHLNRVVRLKSVAT
jgi:hypothetical protein